MCQAEGANEVEQRALCHFRFFVYREYGEVRHLRPGMLVQYDRQADRCMEIRKMDEGGRKREYARELYVQELAQPEPSRILNAFVDAHAGLTPEMLEEIFQADAMGAALGGPRHAAIVRATLSLRDAIETNDWVTAERHVEDLRSLHHNTRRAVCDYRDLGLDRDCCILTPDVPCPD